MKTYNTCLNDRSILRTKEVNFIEKFSQVLNIKPFQPVEGKTKEKVGRLVRTEERNFLQEYWYEYFDNLRKKESHSMVMKVLDKHDQEITRYLRAHLADWLTHVCEVLSKEDFTLPFIAMNMCDRFLMSTQAKLV